jgi:methylated-DNA-[protein]-cysteine S-methyltransferase
MKLTIYFQILEVDNKILEVRFLKTKKNVSNNDFRIGQSSEWKKCEKELEEYLLGKRKIFDVKLKISGTPFQEKVWKEMMKIPYGKTLSYKELAARIGKPKAYRAVANACGKNKIPIMIPCHRVVGSNGLGGYSAGIDIKKKLLEIEGVRIN